VFDQKPTSYWGCRVVTYAFIAVASITVVSTTSVVARAGIISIASITVVSTTSVVARAGIISIASIAGAAATVVSVSDVLVVVVIQWYIGGILLNLITDFNSKG
jgi:hypothetical protein